MVVLKELILKVSTLEGVVVLKELILTGDLEEWINLINFNKLNNHLLSNLLVTK